jgi:hypothetical protein
VRQLAFGALRQCCFPAKIAAYALELSQASLRPICRPALLLNPADYKSEFCAAQGGTMVRKSIHALGQGRTLRRPHLKRGRRLAMRRQDYFVLARIFKICIIIPFFPFSQTPRQASENKRLFLPGRATCAERS